MSTTPFTVVLGAGPVGSGTARLLARRGHRVRVVSRSGSGPLVPGIELVKGDASQPDDALRVTAGATAIVNAVNPPYTSWPTSWPPIHRAVMGAAEATGAVLVLMDNLYAYGPVTVPMTEDLPLAATGHKGRTRAQMEQDLLAAHTAGRIRVAIAKASDYVGAGVKDAALGEHVMPKLLAGRNIVLPGDPDAPHSWTAMDDVTGAVSTLVEDERGWGRSWHVPTNAPVSVRECVSQAAAVAGVRTPKVRGAGSFALSVMGVAVPVMRELKETLYQFDRPFVVDSSAFTQTFGITPTPWDEVLASTVRWWQSEARQHRAA